VILFARHGNTFDPGDKVVWVGRETDLPLVAKGLLQAAQLAGALARKGWIPDVIYCASLKRTRRTAEIVAETLKLPAPIVDGRLDELDYGSWAGRSNDEILAADPAAAAAMEAWNQRDEWPERAGWGSRKEQVLGDLRSFAADRLTGHARPLVVSSNGTLRFLPRLLLDGGEQPSSFKMRTGHLGIIELRDKSMSLAGWDLPPETL
jgi:broad specificity phosphatase PhoE